jgi:hypothetical protein
MVGFKKEKLRISTEILLCCCAAEHVAAACV